MSTPASSTKNPTNPTSTTTISSKSCSSLGITPYEVLDRRYSAAVSLESWEVGAMRSIACDESIPRVRLRLLKSLVGLPTEDAQSQQHSNQASSAYPSGSGSGSSSGTRRRGGGGRRGRSD